MEMVLSATLTVLAALQCAELREVCSIWDYKEDLKKLEDTVEHVKAVLLDASKEVQVEFSHQAQLYIDKLKDAVYDADDLLDEFVTLAKQKKLNDSEKVSHLFSQLNSLGVAYNMSQGVKEISKMLDAIADNHNKFGFKVNYQPIRRRREESCSYINSQDIVGREDDVEKIVGRLLAHNVQRDISCHAIVGMGGLGKTALAQLVYHDTRIEKEFPLRLWTCISDEDPKNLDVKATLCKILHSATNGENHEHLAMEPLQDKLHKQLAGKKYFLVLDDLWNEDRLQWIELEKFLMTGLRGSWIVVTTRSEGTALAVGDEHPHKLKGLSEKDSWDLFVRTAFGQRPEQPNPDLVEIGQEIVQGCANVPLAIKVVGTLLYGQGKRKWLSLQKVAFGSSKLIGDGIKPILKLSYDHLESPLKICFSYCAIFPKDFDMEKEMLISLWIAQGYVVPLEADQSIEDAAEDYFSILLRRCFFQDVHRDVYDDIISCKMHDLLHDIAQEVAGKEIHLANFIPCDLNNKVRHLSYSCFLLLFRGTRSFTSSRIRTCLRILGYHEVPTSDHVLDAMICNWIYLRALDFSGRLIKSLPNTLGKLVHLRYLDLSGNFDLKVLPISITKLLNLETLRLVGCKKLRELPNDLSKLTNLRVLDTTLCESLARMPRGVGKLKCVWKLPFFAVEGISNEDGVQLAEELGEIKALKNLKGKLHIQIGNGIPPNAMEHSRNGGYLREHQHLTDITITLPEWDFEDVRRGVYDEALLEDLQPHPNLRELRLECYCGGRMPNWAKDEKLTTSLPNLVEVSLKSCPKLQHIAVIGKLPKLKFLRLIDLDELEYIENTTMSRNRSGGGSLESEQPFFPSLVEFCLRDLPKLKGWWREDIDNNNWQEDGLLLPTLPNLVTVDLDSCPKLQYIGLIIGKLPKLNFLRLKDLDKLEYIQNTAISWNRSGGGSLESEEAFFPSLEQVCLKHLRKLKGWWRDDIDSNTFEEHGLLLPTLPRVNVLNMQGCPKLAYMPLCNSVEDLSIWDCDVNLRIMGTMESGNSKLKKVVTNNTGHLKLGLPLEAFQFLNELIIEKDNEVENMSEVEEVFRFCSSSLRQLTIQQCSKLKSVCGMLEHLTALESLQLVLLPNLKSVCGALEHLTALERLVLYGLPNLSLSKKEGEEDEDDDAMPWRSLQHCLRSLVLSNLRKVVKLPKGMRYLTALESLDISICSRLESVPEWMPELTSLKKLMIYSCSVRLKKRCRYPTGEDWPNIQHIPDIHIE